MNFTLFAIPLISVLGVLVLAIFGLKLFKLLFSETERQQPKYEQPKYDGNTWDLRLGCPDCGGKRFYEGPQGGWCTNICCANEECMSAFNVGPPYSCERIPNTWFKPRDSVA